MSLALTFLLLVHLQAQVPHPSQSAKANKPGDISSGAIRRDLERRGVKLKDATSNDIVSALTAYDFETGTGSNLNSNDQDAQQALANLNKALETKKLQSSVTARTKNAGARIWCQLVGTGAPFAFARLSNDSVEAIPIGIYFFWSERSGHKTSTLIQFRVISPQFQIDIEESLNDAR